MNNSSYFLKSGAKILGPLSLDQLQSLHARGRIKADFVVSKDKKSWQAVDVVLNDVSNPPSVATLSLQEEWYYTQGEGRIGPVSRSDLIELIDEGSLLKDDLVWKEGFANWTAIRELQELHVSGSRVQRNRASAVSPVPGSLRLCLSCGIQQTGAGEFCPHCGSRCGRQGQIVVSNAALGARDHKERIVAALLALFLGGIGIHHFYLGNTLLGVIYLLFCWTFIPSLISLIEGIVFLCTSNQSFNAQYNTPARF